MTNKANRTTTARDEAIEVIGLGRVLDLEMAGLKVTTDSKGRRTTGAAPAKQSSKRR